MKATVFHGANDICIEEVNRPRAGIGEAVIRVTLTTICGTDLHMEVGSIWGHGSYVAPDGTADWLHREAVFMLDQWANTGYSSDFEELDNEQRRSRFSLSAAIKSRFVSQPWYWSGLETLGLGGAAVLLADIVGYCLSGGVT